MSPFIFEGVGPNRGREREILTQSTRGFSKRIRAHCNFESLSSTPRMIAKERCFVLIEEGEPLVIQCRAERSIFAFGGELMLDLHCTPFTVSEPTNGDGVLVEKIIHERFYSR